VINLKTDDIYIGQDGHHPSDHLFTLAPEEAIGLFPHNPGDPGVFIGYDQEETLWQVYVSGFHDCNMKVDSATPIVDLETLGFTSCDGAMADRLLVFRSGAFQDMTWQSGLNLPSACGSVAAADFDNDMDIDLYLVCRSLVVNLPNRLYENLGDGTFAMVPGAGGAAGSTAGRGDSVALADYDEDGFMDLLVTNGHGAPPFDIGPDQLFRNIGNDNHWIEIDLEGVLSNRDGIGAQVFVTTSGFTQFREQVGGMHLGSQNHQRVHVGLAGNESVDRLTVEWPSGTSQEITNIPANQIIRVVEPSYPSLLGNPDYTPGKTSGIYLWKETFDGPYRLRVSGEGPLAVFTVDILADQALTNVVPVALEDNDNLFWIDNTLSFTGRVTTGEKGIDFSLPPGTYALIAVERDNTPNPRQLHIGSSGKPVTPSGWVLAVQQLSPMPSPIPDFQPGQDLGLFVRTAFLQGDILMRWSGDGYRHNAELRIVFSNDLFDVQPVNFESCCNSLFLDERSVQVSAIMSTGWAGLDIQVPADSAIGLSYHQDGLFQPHRVNGKTRDLGLPNAYALPYADIYGSPIYDSAQDKGLFVWKSQTEVWHLRSTAGGDYGRYEGAIVSSLPVISAQAWSLESNDKLEVSADQKRVDFDLRVRNSVQDSGQDGIDIVLPEGSEVSLELNGNTAEAASLVQVGGERWPVEKLPVVLAQ